MTKIDVISGFLGAGKTTLIKKLLKEALTDTKVVLIENEFGEIGIDGGFLKEAGIEIKEMNSGCICCSLVGDFGASLQEVLSTYAPERILIEPSGVGKLSDVLKAVENVAGDLDVEISSAVAVVDAAKCKMYMKNFGEFFINQIECAGTIVLSRGDKVSQEKINECVDMIREHNQTAVIITTPLAQLEGKEVLNTMEGAGKLEDMMKEMLEEVHEGRHHHDHNGEGCCGHGHEGHHHHDHNHGEESCCGHGHEGHHHHDHDHGEEACCGHGHEGHHDHDHEGEGCCGHGHEGHHDHDHEGEGCCGHGHEGYHHHDHNHGEEGCCGQGHEGHHDHDQDKEGCCGHGHEGHHHHGHEGHHHADEVFASWGMETSRPYSRDEIEQILTALDSGEYGVILRAKGMVPAEDGSWIYYDYVPEEHDIRDGRPGVTGKLCVIGAQLEQEKLAELFGVAGTTIPK